MNQLPPDKNSEVDGSLFKQSAVMLLDEKQWLYLKKRYHLTRRELQVARFVCNGLNNNEIAKALKIRHGTVKTHLRNIYRRVRVKSKITLLLRFVEDVNIFSVPSEHTPAQIPIADKDLKAVKPI